MVAGYFTESVSWQANTGFNEFGKTAYAAPQTIAVRLENKQQLTRRPDGDLPAAETLVFCTSLVNVGDLLTIAGKTWPVEAVQIYKGLTGEGYRMVYLGRNGALPT